MESVSEQLRGGLLTRFQSQQAEIAGRRLQRASTSTEQVLDKKSRVPGREEHARAIAERRKRLGALAATQTLLQLRLLHLAPGWKFVQHGATLQ